MFELFSACVGRNAAQPVSPAQSCAYRLQNSGVAVATLLNRNTLMGNNSVGCLQCNLVAVSSVVAFFSEVSFKEFNLQKFVLNT